MIHSLLRTLARLLDRPVMGDVSLDDQYRTPRGLSGMLVGEDMLRQHRPENRWTLALLKVKPTDHILEIGSGPGLLLNLISQLLHGGQVWGLDLSRSMVRLASLHNWPAVLQGKVRLRQGNAAHLPFGKGMFDTVVSVHSIYFWKDPSQVLQESRRVLKPRGKMVVTFMPRHHWPHQGEKSTCHVFSEQEMVQLFQEAGFVQVRVDPGESHFRECAVVGHKAPP